MKKEEKSNNKGLITLIVCAVLTVAIIVGCVFFPDLFFGFFKK